MPRSHQKHDRLTEAARVRRLRNLLGMTQRELAAEFNVANGAVAGWETGHRALPGPVRRLLDLYEREIGTSLEIAEEPRLKTSGVSRSLAVSGIAAFWLAEAARNAFQHLLTSGDEPEALQSRTRRALAGNAVKTLGELKGLAMKAGQWLAFAEYILPPDSRAEFEQLFAAGTPMAPAAITTVFLRTFGRAPAELFAEWSPTPVAAASIGQVHRARLHDGQIVAVKVQYPQIVDALRADLRFLTFIDRLAVGIFRGQARGEYAAELRDRLLEECDYVREATNQETFRGRWGGDAAVRIPRVHPEFSGDRVLVSDFIEGERFTAFCARATGADRDAVGTTLARVMLHSMFSHRTVFADPHPGNFLVQGRTLTVLDFGCIKILSPDIVEQWRDLLRSIIERRFEDTRGLMVRFGWVPNPARFDFEYQERLLQLLCAPWLREGPFHYTDSYARLVWEAWSQRNPNRFRANVPRDWIFAGRMLLGMRSRLTQLQARVDMRSIMLRELYRSPADYPPPFTASECAAAGLSAHG